MKHTTKTQLFSPLILFYISHYLPSLSPSLSLSLPLSLFLSLPPLPLYLSFFTLFSYGCVMIMSHLESEIKSVTVMQMSPLQKLKHPANLNKPPHLYRITLINHGKRHLSPETCYSLSQGTNEKQQPHTRRQLK